MRTYSENDLESLEALADLFMERFDGILKYSPRRWSWATLCNDGRWRKVETRHFEWFLQEWTEQEAGERIHCGQSSPFKQKLQREMIGTPRVSMWKEGITADPAILKYMQLDWSNQNWR